MKKNITTNLYSFQYLQILFYCFVDEFISYFFRRALKLIAFINNS